MSAALHSSRSWFVAVRAGAAVACGLLVLAPTLVTAQQGDTSIVAMDNDGANLQTLLAVSGQWCGTPGLSPDGTLLLFDMSPPRAFGVTRIYTLPMAMPDDEPTDLGPGYAPAWSPDGSRIIFYLTPLNRDGIKSGVWVMNADGSNRTWLCEGKAPRFSPDGQRVSFINNPNGQGENIYVLDLRTDEITPALDHSYQRIAGAAWSPDGTRLAVIVRLAEGAELLIVPTDGDDRTALVRLTEDIGWRPNWSPDGKYLLFWIRDDAGHERLHRLEVDGEREPELLAHQDERSFNSDAIWSPDGKQVIWIRDER